MSTRSPRELIEIYWERVYNNAESELIREVCADPIIRHDPGVVLPLSHDEQIERVKRSLAVKPLFTHRVLHADERFVTSVWNMVSRDGRNVELCGIEVFEAEGGRFIRCWNSTYMKGLWGEDGDLFDPAALAPPLLVAAPGEITADWMERALAAGGAVKAERVAMLMHVEPIGHGTTSTVAHVRVAYNSGHPTAPTTAICKIGRKADAASPAVGPYERERRAFALFGDRPPFRVPRLYYGASDAAGLTNLLLEDLSASAIAGDQIAGCSPAEAGAVVRELARFHRCYLDSPGVMALDWLFEPQSMFPVYARGAGVLREWRGEAIGSGALAAIAQFGILAENWCGLTPAHRTLVHGDPRVDNVLFEETPQGLRACLIDWQSLSTGDPLQDVAYFLSGSLSPIDRRACERELVAEHTALLAGAGHRRSLEDALETYRRNVVSGLWMTVIAAAFVERNSHNARLLDVLVERNVAAIEDWDAFAAIG